MASRRFLLRSAALASCLALAAVSGWAVRPYLPGPGRAAAPSAESVPETTEDLIARLEELRSQKRELERKEREFSEQVRSQQSDIDRQAAAILSELKKRDKDNQRRLTNLGHRADPSLVSIR
jgi:TolA-binding protein